MTVISAPTSSLDQSAPHGESADAVIDHLATSSGVNLWGPISSLFLSLCSFGLLPLLVWPRRWNQVIEIEREQMISLAGYWRRRASVQQAQLLDRQVERLRPQSILSVVPVLILVFVGIMFVSFFNDGRSMQNVVDLTFGYPRYYWAWSTNDVSMHKVWVASLLVGYICHWMAVRSHVSGMDSVARTIGSITGSRGVGRSAYSASGLNPMWIIVAIVLCGANAWWSIPLVMAGAKQRAYVRQTSPRLRQMLAEQLRDPGQGQGATVATVRTGFCRTPLCGTPVRPQAKYCPRCGAAV